MLRRSLAFLVVLFLIPCPLFAFPDQDRARADTAAPQSASLASVGGVVLDATRAAIAGARVTATPVGRHTDATVLTGAHGEFLLTLGAGDYVVATSAQGFKEASQRVTVPQNGTALLTFVLDVRGVKETVSVSGAGGYRTDIVTSATRTTTPLRDVPQSVTVVTGQLIKDQLMTSMGDVVRYVPGITAHQGENNRDQIVIRGNSSSADFFLNGIRDDVQYYRDLYNLDRVEALKGPNAMIFGRGGGGGVINRVTKDALLQSVVREVMLQAGSFGHTRVAADLNQPIAGAVAVRLTAMYEHSDSFRQAVGLERFGVNPTVTFAPGPHTRIVVRYEQLHDTRVADRGITSLQGRPADVDVRTFFGNPDDSHVKARVHLASAAVDQRFGRVTLRNATQFGHYDRAYQNFVPGAVNASRTLVALSAYNNATGRQNVFNQTDLTFSISTGRVRHRLLGGAEFGRQLTDNFRNTGYFNNTAATISVAYDHPRINTPVTFRQSATDANNHIETRVAAVYTQDQIDVSRHLMGIVGVRRDRFDLTYHNNRNGDTLRRTDDLLSPRAGLVLKPLASLSIYGSYGVSYLPSSGDQFSSLTIVTQQVKPEKFANVEGGAKWDPRPSLSLTTAIFRLARKNTRATDPNDPARIVQTGAQRTDGVELGVNGQVTLAWSIAGGYAYQDARVTSATTAAVAGATPGQVPRHTVSLWNNYQLSSRLGVGFGILRRTAMYATIDDSVVLPGYTRADVAAFLAVTSRIRLQANVENLLDRRYYVNADSNTNISPGTPRALRAGLSVKF